MLWTRVATLPQTQKRRHSGALSIWCKSCVTTWDPDDVSVRCTLYWRRALKFRQVSSTLEFSIVIVAYPLTRVETWPSALWAYAAHFRKAVFSLFIHRPVHFENVALIYYDCVILPLHNSLSERKLLSKTDNFLISPIKATLTKRMINYSLSKEQEKQVYSAYLIIYTRSTQTESQKIIYILSQKYRMLFLLKQWSKKLTHDKVDRLFVRFCETVTLVHKSHVSIVAVMWPWRDSKV